MPTISEQQDKNEPDTEEATPNLVRQSLFQCQVCVPKWFTDSQALQAAESLCPCGTANGWQLDRTEERVQCAKYSGNVHMLYNA